LSWPSLMMLARTSSSPSLMGTARRTLLFY
jgi:hypothetical protein